MTLDAVIMLTGAFVAVLPFLGFPTSWDTVFFFLAGVLVIALGIIVRRRDAEGTIPTERTNGTFSESAPTAPTTHEEKERME